MEIGAEGIGVTDDDFAAELGEVDTQVDGEQGLAHTSATTAHGDDAARPHARRIEHGRRRNRWRQPIG